MKTVSEELRELATWLHGEDPIELADGRKIAYPGVRVKADQVRTLAARCEGMVSLSAVEEAVRHVVTSYPTYDFDSGEVADLIVARLKGGS